MYPGWCFNRQGTWAFSSNLWTSGEVTMLSSTHLLLHVLNTIHKEVMHRHSFFFFQVSMRLLHFHQSASLTVCIIFISCPARMTILLDELHGAKLKNILVRLLVCWGLLGLVVTNHFEALYTQGHALHVKIYNGVVGWRGHCSWILQVCNRPQVYVLVTF